MKRGIFVVWVEDWRLEKIRSLLICVIWFRGTDQQVPFGRVTPPLVRKRRIIAQIWVGFHFPFTCSKYWMNPLKFRCTLMLRFFQIFSKMKIKRIFRESGLSFPDMGYCKSGFWLYVNWITCLKKFLVESM